VAQPTYLDPRAIPDVDLAPAQQAIRDKIVKMISFVFDSRALPVKIVGFLLEGSYQTGKTEIVKQAMKVLKETYTDLKYSFNDSATIASPAFGESERILSNIFVPPSTQNGIFKRIIMLDDIDCLFFGRDVRVSQSWHISLSSVLFHALDELDPRMTIVIATTNKPDIVDGALRTRLMRITVPKPTIDDLVTTARTLVVKMGLTSKQCLALMNIVKSRITKDNGYRDIQQYIIETITEHDLTEKSI
jgi:SpoVK/Ycf46/Vps4 family AAA+-type ATPase